MTDQPTRRAPEPSRFFISDKGYANYANHAAPEPTAPDDRCTCEPCAGRGNDGHGLTHCAECCMGTGIEDADPACPNPAHRALAKRQHGPAPDDLREQALAALAWLVRLKDGPRDDTYRAEKEQAWEAARDVLRQRGVVKP